MFAIGYLAVFMIGYANGRAPLRHFTNELLNLPVRWDAGWYLGIALNGYDYDANARPTAQQNVAFFPAYPMAMRAVTAWLSRPRATANTSILESSRPSATISSRCWRSM